MIVFKSSVFKEDDNAFNFFFRIIFCFKRFYRIIIERVEGIAFSIFENKSGSDPEGFSIVATGTLISFTSILVLVFSDLGNCPFPFKINTNLLQEKPL